MRYLNFSACVVLPVLGSSTWSKQYWLYTAWVSVSTTACPFLIKNTSNSTRFSLDSVGQFCRANFLNLTTTSEENFSSSSFLPVVMFSEMSLVPFPSWVPKKGCQNGNLSH